jgi:hypothetical protein
MSTRTVFTFWILSSTAGIFLKIMHLSPFIADLLIATSIMALILLVYLLCKQVAKNVFPFWILSFTAGIILKIMHLSPFIADLLISTSFIALFLLVYLRYKQVAKNSRISQ